MGTDLVEGALESVPSPPMTLSSAPMQRTVKESVSIAPYRVRYRRLKCHTHSRGELRSVNTPTENHSTPSSAQSDVPHSCPLARYGHSLTEIQPEVVFLFAGVSGSGTYLNDAWVFLLHSTATTAVSIPVFGDIPCGRFGHSAHPALGDTAVMVFGGSNNTEWFNDLFVVAKEGLLRQTEALFRRVAWESVPSPPVSISIPVSSLVPSARRSHTLTPVSDGVAVLFGGLARLSMSDVWTLHEETFGWRRVDACGAVPSNPLAEMPSSRYCHSAVVYPKPTPRVSGKALRGSLFVFGGVLFSAAGDAAMWELDLSTWVWREVQITGRVVPQARFGHSACVVSNGMILFGGTDRFPGGRNLDDCFMFSFPKRKWERFDTVSSRKPLRDTRIPLETHFPALNGREGAEAISLQHSAAPHPLPALFRLGQCLLTEEMQHHKPHARRLHAAVQCSPGKVFIFGGWDGTDVDDGCFQLVVAPSTLREWASDFLCTSQRAYC